MTDKEFRRLSRIELIDIIYELQKREKRYEKRIKNLEAQLADRELKIAESGSIAEAALKVNEVFEHAQAAADVYLAEIEAMRDRLAEQLEDVEEEEEDDE